MKKPNGPLFSPTPAGSQRDALPTWNRLLDIFCCLLALPVLSFWFLLMTLVTKAVSPGPVFFRQERVGFQGRRFNLLKFRTMSLGADTTAHQQHLKELITSNAPMVKLDVRDARLIPGGWLLRASGLDELPQIINILRGDMSLVGPRPCIASEFEQFLPWQRERINALPGLTGLWQVSGKNRTTFDEMIRLDIHYARQPSLGLNLKIIFLTPWAMVVQIGDTLMSRKSAPVLAATLPLTPVPLALL